MEPGVKSELEKIEHYAYDTRNNRVFKFRRMNKHVLLQWEGILMRITSEEFDEFFEGTPPPLEPLLTVR